VQHSAEPTVEMATSKDSGTHQPELA